MSPNKLLTLWALFVNNISLVSNEYTSVVIQAVICSATALALLGLSWLRLAWVGRVFSAIVAMGAGWTLIDAAGRRLPAAMGW